MDYCNGCFLSIMDFPIVFPLLVVGTITLIILRVIYIIYRSSKPVNTRSPGSLSTLIVLGSGGHTAEMLNLLAMLQKERFKPRYYVAAATDNMSLQKARVLEDSLVDEAGIDVVGTAHFMQIYRSREVGQSYITSVGTTLIAIAHALWLMVRIQPQVILCNGPGTCIPLCAISFFLKVWTVHFTSYFLERLLHIAKVFGIRWSSIFYVESIARVKRLSLSGLLLYKLHMADQLFVQWPQLKSNYPRTKYVGRLM